MHTQEIKIGSFVEDMSGCTGEVTGLGEFVATVRVKFGPDCYRDLDPAKLKLSKYSPAQIDRMRASAPAMLEALETVIKHGLIEQDGYSTTVKKVWDAINQAKGL